MNVYAQHNKSKMNKISITYTCKYCVSFAPEYWFTTKGNICYNTKTNNIIKQVDNSGCLGYYIRGKFKSLTFLRDNLIVIPPHNNNTPFD